MSQACAVSSPLQKDFECYGDFATVEDSSSAHQAIRLLPTDGLVGKTHWQGQGVLRRLRQRI